MRQFIATMVLLFCFVVNVRSEDVFVGKPERIDPGTAEGRFGLEFCASARNGGKDVVALWMKRPVPPGHGTGDMVMRRLYSNNYMLSWYIEDFAFGINAREVDPMCCHDPVTNHFFVGGKSGKRLYVSRVASNANPADPFDDHVLAFHGGADNVDCHRPVMTAGPHPNTGETRIYVWAAFKDLDTQQSVGDLIWSDDLNGTWTNPAEIGDSYFAIESGLGGRFYIVTQSVTTFDIFLRRSDSLAAGVPVFKSDSTLGNTDTSFNPTWLPGTFRKQTYFNVASSPLDSNKVYVIWLDKSEDLPDGNWNVDVFFRRTENAMADTVTWLPASGRIIIPADEPGVEPVEGDQFLQWFEITTFNDGTGLKERLHLFWMDTRLNAEQNDLGNGGDEHALLDAWYAYSDDQGNSWSQRRLTLESFDVAGSGPLDLEGEEFFGDYVGMAAAGKRIFALYAIAGDPYGLVEFAVEVFMNYIVFGTGATQNSYTVTAGAQTGGTANALLAADETPTEDVVTIAPAQSTPTTFKAQLDVIFTHVLATGEETFDLRIETGAMAVGANSRIELMNWNTGLWDLVRVTNNIPDKNQREYWQRGLDPAKYIRSTDGRLEMRLSQEAFGTFPIPPIAVYDFAQVIVVDDP